MTSEDEQALGGILHNKRVSNSKDTQATPLVFCSSSLIYFVADEGTDEGTECEFDEDVFDANDFKHALPNLASSWAAHQS